MSVKIEEKQQYQIIKWEFVTYFFILYVSAIVGTVFLMITHRMHAATWLLALGFVIVNGFSITAGYHRLFSHRCYKANKIIEALFLFFGAGAFVDSVISWSRDHRCHHRYTDTQNDPYNIKAGFFSTHFFWIFYKKNTINQSPSFENIQDLRRNKLVMFQNKFYIPIAITAGLILPVLIASTWHDPWGGFFIAGLFRIAFGHQLIFCVNSAAHYWGKQTYDTEKTPRDNFFVALLTFGEGYHSYHHAFPFDYRNGVGLFKYDPAKWLIKSLSVLGLATHRSS